MIQGLASFHYNFQLEEPPDCHISFEDGQILFGLAYHKEVDMIADGELRFVILELTSEEAEAMAAALKLAAVSSTAKLKVAEIG
jgi:hypothetical protein